MALWQLKRAVLEGAGYKGGQEPGRHRLDRAHGGHDCPCSQVSRARARRGTCSPLSEAGRIRSRRPRHRQSLLSKGPPRRTIERSMSSPHSFFIARATGLKRARPPEFSVSARPRRVEGTVEQAHPGRRQDVEMRVDLDFEKLDQTEDFLALNRTRDASDLWCKFRNSSWRLNLLGAHAMARPWPPRQGCVRQALKIHP